MINKLNNRADDNDQEFIGGERPFCKGSWRINGLLLSVLIIFTFFGGFYLLDEYHFETDDGKYVIPLLNVVPNDAEFIPSAWNGGQLNNQNKTKTQQLATHVLPAVASLVDSSGKFVASGVLVNSRGHLVTTWHSISGLNAVQVKVRTSNGFKLYKTEVVRIQSEHDLVLLKLQTKDKFLYLPVPLNPELLMTDQVSSFGIGIGGDIIYKSGVTGSMPTTLNVAKRQLKQILSTDAVYSWEQTGGPLVDNSGRLVGINLAIQNTQGTIDGYVVPSKFIRQHFAQWLPQSRTKKKL